MAEEDKGAGKLNGYYEGPVVDNVDPKKLGRVRVRIPAIAEPTGWAFPVFGLGGGAKKRGNWNPPPIGAEVGVMFKNGDPESPRYFGGGPIGEGEAPDEVTDSGTSPADAVKIPFIWQGERYKIVVDERPGKFRCALEDMKTGDMYELDGVKLGLNLKSTAAMNIACDGALNITCSSFTVNGRRMAPNKKPW